MNAKTIMLVDDNQDDIDLTLRAIRKSKIGNQVVVARNGAEAIDYLFGTGPHAGRDTSVQPQVVLMDLKMPKMGGLETLRRMRADPRTHNVPVVILTSSKEESDIIGSYDHGANSFVRKPVDFVQFTETVQHLNLYWLVINEVAPGIAIPREKDHE